MFLAFLFSLVFASFLLLYLSFIPSSELQSRATTLCVLHWVRSHRLAPLSTTGEVLTSPENPHRVLKVIDNHHRTQTSRSGLAAPEKALLGSTAAEGGR